MLMVVMIPPAAISHAHAGGLVLAARADGNFEVPHRLVPELAAQGFAVQPRRSVAPGSGVPSIAGRDTPPRAVEAAQSAGPEPEAKSVAGASGVPSSGARDRGKK